MARKCKCRICGKDLTTDIAYNIPKVVKGDKIKNQYYCSLEEYREFESNRIRQLELLRENQRLIDDILGYVCVNNTKNTELSKLYGVYSKEQINELIKNLKDDIIGALDSKKDTMNEYQKIRYIFAILNNHVKDYFTERKSIEVDTTEYDKVDEGIEVETEIPSRVPIRKKKKRTGLLDIL